ncbi:hypothetical protein [Chitinophaga vietnamensis]|uniref:hypothetical protein n=1 Tax=Chitinophaga vietnamensis TaxID=2593957 RepID=UPI001177A680|nr:hypothetical protein [Chitinophaga vietnamensis]
MYPIYIFQNKKIIRTAIILYTLILLMFCWGLFGSRGFFKGGIYYAVLVIMPVAIICLLITLARKLRQLRHSGPVITLLREGITFTEAPFREIGVVKWADITACFDAPGGLFNEKFLFIGVANPDEYISKVDAGQRDRFAKQCRKKQALLWTEADLLKYDLVELKRTIFQSIDHH